MPSGPLAASFQSQQEPSFHIDPVFQNGMGAIANDQSVDSEIAMANVQDWLLLGVKVAHEQSHDIWFVRLSALGPPISRDASEAPKFREFIVPFGMAGVKTGSKFTAPATRLRIEIFDHNGFLTKSSVRVVPEVYSSTTLLDVLTGMQAALSSDTPEAADAEDVPQPNMPGVLTFVQLLGGAKALAPIRESIRDHIITKPSLLAIVLNGLKVKVEAKVDEREMVHSPWSIDEPLMPREEATFPVLLCGHRLFDCRMIVAPPNPPYNLTAGALLIEAVHPEKSSNRLTVCVLNAKKAGAATLVSRAP